MGPSVKWWHDHHGTPWAFVNPQGWILPPRGWTPHRRDWIGRANADAANQRRSVDFQKSIGQTKNESDKWSYGVFTSKPIISKEVCIHNSEKETEFMLSSRILLWFTELFVKHLGMSVDVHIVRYFSWFHQHGSLANNKSIAKLIFGGFVR